MNGFGCVWGRYSNHETDKLLVPVDESSEDNKSLLMHVLKKKGRKSKFEKALLLLDNKDRLLQRPD